MKMVMLIVTQSNISTQSKTCEVSTTSINRKRKLDPASNVPKLVDNKRKNLEKRLSAAQRNQKLLGAAKEDTAMRKEMLECFKDSSSSTALKICLLPLKICLKVWLKQCFFLPILCLNHDSLLMHLTSSISHY